MTTIIGIAWLGLPAYVALNVVLYVSRKSFF
jgi:hypothetical protein